MSDDANEGRYTLEATVRISDAADEVMRWLTEPELIGRWVAGVDSVEAVDPVAPASGSSLRIEISHGAYAGWSFLGDVTEQGDRTLVRRYRLEGSRAGAIPQAHGQADYERTASYSLGETPDGGSVLRAVVVTAIPGLRARAAKAGMKAEQRGLELSLEHLRAAVEGKQRGPLSRLRESGKSAGPL